MIGANSFLWMAYNFYQERGQKHSINEASNEMEIHKAMDLDFTNREKQWTIEQSQML